jgi:hypothetical protein
MSRRKTPAEDYAEAGFVHAMADATKDGTFIVARDKSGDTAHIRWRMQPDLEEDDEEPYWARLDTDEAFYPIGWVEPSWTDDDFTRVYE